VAEAAPEHIVHTRYDEMLVALGEQRDHPDITKPAGAYLAQASLANQDLAKITPEQSERFRAYFREHGQLESAGQPDSAPAETDERKDADEPRDDLWVIQSQDHRSGKHRLRRGAKKVLKALSYASGVQLALNAMGRRGAKKYGLRSGEEIRDLLRPSEGGLNQRPDHGGAPHAGWEPEDARRIAANPGPERRPDKLQALREAPGGFPTPPTPEQTIERARQMGVELPERERRDGESEHLLDAIEQRKDLRHLADELRVEALRLAQVYDVLDRFPRLQAWLSAAQKQGLGGHDRRAPEVTPEEQELEAPLVAQLEREADEAEMMAEALTGTIRKG
jgi:hypothetical protein